jgi:hypothetical protein
LSYPALYTHLKNTFLIQDKNLCILW